jgi:hypothetical protein
MASAQIYPVNEMDCYYIIKLLHSATRHLPSNVTEMPSYMQQSSELRLTS